MFNMFKKQVLEEQNKNHLLKKKSVFECINKTAQTVFECIKKTIEFLVMTTNYLTSFEVFSLLD